MRPVRLTPSRDASRSSELAAKSSPSACLSRSAGPASPAPAAGQSKPEPISVENEKRASGWLSARRLHDVGHRLGLGSVGFQELEPCGRGGEEISRLDPRARGLAAGLTGLFKPVLDDEPASPSARPAGRVRISSRDTEAIEGSASPRKPKVAMAVRSPSGIFEVACRSTASASRLRPCRARRRSRG